MVHQQTLAGRLRAIAADPTAAAIAELPRIAFEVARVVAALDEIAENERAEIAHAAARAATMARMRRAGRHRGRLMVVEAVR